MARPPAPPPLSVLRLLGAVLAGGEGRRLGESKPQARVGGTPLVERAVEVLREVTPEVVVVSSRPVGSVSAPVIPDRMEGAGPLAGLEAALRRARGAGQDGVLLLACDLPLVTAPFLRRVAAALPGRRAVAPARPGGGIEPLCAAYSVELLPVVEARLRAEDRSLHALFREAGGYVVPADEAPMEHACELLNVNTHEDLARAREALMPVVQP